jgi:hypothetical protein
MTAAPFPSTPLILGPVIGGFHKDVDVEWVILCPNIYRGDRNVALCLLLNDHEAGHLPALIRIELPFKPGLEVLGQPDRKLVDVFVSQAAVRAWRRQDPADDLRERLQDSLCATHLRFPTHQRPVR